MLSRQMEGKKLHFIESGKMLTDRRLKKIYSGVTYSGALI